ncbi:hypothetical protein GCM10010388_73650 [Streptomyces mauvecolor]
MSEITLPRSILTDHDIGGSERDIYIHQVAKVLDADSGNPHIPPRCQSSRTCRILRNHVVPQRGA